MHLKKFKFYVPKKLFLNFSETHFIFSKISNFSIKTLKRKIILYNCIFEI